ncbi:hypothetical protein BGX27_010135, partial [Mortierella sp. AM989]
MGALFGDNPHTEPLAQYATTRHGVPFKNKDHAYTRMRLNASALVEIGDERLDNEDEVLVGRRGSRVTDLEQVEEELAMKNMAVREERSEADSKADAEKDDRMLERVELELEKTKVQAEAEIVKAEAETLETELQKEWLIAVRELIAKDFSKTDILEVLGDPPKVNLLASRI